MLQDVAPDGVVTDVTAGWFGSNARLFKADHRIRLG